MGYEHGTPLGTRAYTGEWLVTALLEDRAARFGDELAVEAPDGDATYADLVTRAARVAGYLASIGVDPGDTVATMLPNSLAYMAAWHGIIWRGAIDVPINAEYRGVFLEHVLRDSRATAIVVDGGWVDRLAEIELTHLRHVIVHGGTGAQLPAHLGVHDLADAVAADPAPLTPPALTDTTYVIYTSGTTGAPKGAMHNHRSSFHYVMPFVEGLELDDDDVCLSMFPLFHQMGRSACVTSALFAGNRIVLRNGFSASGFWDDVRATDSSWMGYFGVVIQFLMRQDPSPLDREHRMSRAFGASAPPELFDEWEERFGCTLYEVYGSTELGLGSGLGSGPRRKGTMGLPCRQVEVQIVDELDEPVPTGEIGEAVWRPRYPDAMFQGYLNREDATVEAWRNLWFHSGDAGFLDEDGYFTFVDRIKDSIRRRGENISTMLVEQAVRQAEPRIQAVAAYAVPSPDAELEEEVMIAFIPPDGPPVDVAAMLRTLARTMPRHAVPRFVRTVTDFPLTPTQRVRKFLLRDEGVPDDAVDRVALGIEIPR